MSWVCSKCRRVMNWSDKRCLDCGKQIPVSEEKQKFMAEAEQAEKGQGGFDFDGRCVGASFISGVQWAYDRLQKESK